ncbi:hypothetical protein ACFOYU_26110 [Microvirga sp. GCM10011540]|uniref:hypothetical protein n=1 Tax=Microvirga sp. GCM10011540 TaxID=3317338 RepID=UPI00361A8EDD
MKREVADGLLESLRPTRHLLTRTLAAIPVGGPEYRQIDRVVQEIDGLAEILIGNETHYHQEGHSFRMCDAGRRSE